MEAQSHDAGEAVAWRCEAVDPDTVFIRACFTNRSFDRHAHGAFVIGLNERGAHRSYFRGSEITVPGAGVVAFAPDEVHSGVRVSSEPWHYRGFYIAPSFFRRLVQECCEGNGDDIDFGQAVIEDPTLFSMLRRTHRHAERASDPVAIESGLVRSLTYLVRRYATWGSTPLPRRRRRREVERAREFIEETYRDRPTLQQMAAAAGLSRYHFLRVFERELGMTPHSYLTDRRVRRAAELLDSGMPIGRVPWAVGFSDQSHLTRWFKRTMGVTPGQYARRRHVVQQSAVVPSSTWGARPGSNTSGGGD